MPSDWAPRFAGEAASGGRKAGEDAAQANSCEAADATSAASVPGRDLRARRMDRAVREPRRAVVGDI
jgi:hypothetical protein